MQEMFEMFDDEFLKFERVENKLSPRPDLHAFIMLDRLQPRGRDLVCAAGHDEIWLDIDVEKLSMIITEDQVRDLVRCGVRYDAGTDSLALFV